MSSTTLRELVHRVADARRRKAQYDEFVRSVRAEFDEANADLFAQHREAAEALAVAEREVRTMAEAAYRETGETKPAPGVAIRVSEKPEYDEAKALEWAKSTGMALIPEQLDAKAFAKIAKATPLPFVTMAPVPTVTLASDLDAALLESLADRLEGK